MLPARRSGLRLIEFCLRHDLQQRAGPASAIIMGVFATGVAASVLLILAHDRPFTGEIAVGNAPQNKMKEHRRRKAPQLPFISHIESAGRTPQIIGEGYIHGGFSKSLDVVGGLRHAGPGGASAA